MFSTKGSSITASTRKEMVAQDARKILEESTYQQNQASLLHISLRQRMVTWIGITVVSLIVLGLTFSGLLSYSQDFKKLSQDMTEISKTLKDTQKDITPISTKVGETQKDIKQLSTKVGDTRKDIEELSTKVQNTQDKIEELSTKVETIPEKFILALMTVGIISGIVFAFGVIQTISLIGFQSELGQSLELCKVYHDDLDNLIAETPPNKKVKSKVQELTGLSEIAKNQKTLSETALGTLIGLGIGFFIMGSMEEPDLVKGLGVIITFSGSLTWVEKQIERNQKEKPQKEARKPQKELKEEQKEIEKWLEEKEKDCNPEFYNLKLNRLKYIYQMLSKYDSLRSDSDDQRLLVRDDTFSHPQQSTQKEENSAQANTISTAKEPAT
ncbi:MAG: hypothetical protein AB4062_02100 [Crocosphaera sp.]